MYELIQTPRQQPVITPEQVAAFGRFDLPQDDAYQNLLLCIEAATDQVEIMAAQACLNEQILLTFDYFPGQQDPRNLFDLTYQFTTNPFWWYGFPTKDSIELVRRPVIVPSGSPLVNDLVINYNDTDGNPQVVDPSTYTVYADKLTLNVGCNWPLTDRRQDCIQISYWVGYSATDPTQVPASIRMAILYLANHLYSVPQIVTVEPTTEVGFTLCRMLAPYRSMRIPR